MAKKSKPIKSEVYCRAEKAAATLLVSVFGDSEDDAELTDDLRMMIRDTIYGDMSADRAIQRGKCPTCLRRCVAYALAAELAFANSIMEEIGDQCQDTEQSQ